MDGSEQKLRPKSKEKANGAGGEGKERKTAWNQPQHFRNFRLPAENITLDRLIKCQKNLPHCQSNLLFPFVADDLFSKNWGSLRRLDSLVFLTKGAFHLTELTGQTGHLEGLTLQSIQTNTLRGWYILPQTNARDYHASVPSNCCIFFANCWVWQASSDKRKVP